MLAKTQNVELMIKACPCCAGVAEFVDVKSSQIILWQLACNQCGLATNLEDKKSTCLFAWNKRTRDSRIKVIGSLIILAMLLISSMAFVLGMMFSSTI